jgi:tetratricopeptide (TPR) repeat protein
MYKFDIEALVTDARALTADKKFAEARALLEEGLAVVPRHLTMLDLLGFVCFFMGDYAACEAHCRAALDIQPDHAYATKGLGLALTRLGHVDEGIRKLERAVALEPHWFDPYWDLVVVLVENARWKEADEVIRRATSTVPGAERGFAPLAAQVRANLRA